MAFPTMITINGTLKKIDGTAEKGHIVFQAPVNVLSSTDATVVVPSYKVVTLDENGAFSVSLPASNDPSWNPNNWTYRVSEQLSARTREYRTIVPYDAVGGQFDYPDLVPAIDVDAQLYALYNHTHPGGGGDAVDWADIVNKPTTFPPATHNHDDRYYTESEITALFAAIDYPVDSVAGKTGVVTLVKGDVGLGNVDNTSDVNKPISTATQTALDSKAALSHTHTMSQITDLDFPVDTVAGRTGNVVLTKSDVGLSNVDNTSDTNKPISSATQSALDLKAPLASPSFTGTVSGITKSMVGLGNVDNTADASKTFTRSQVTDIGAKVIVLNVGDPVPGGTPSGTVIVRI